MFAGALLTGIVSQRSLQNSPLESSCVIVALIENHSTSKPLKVSPEKSQILSCDTVVANERYITHSVKFKMLNIPLLLARVQLPGLHKEICQYWDSNEHSLFPKATASTHSTAWAT
jgi:hypothetical protein